MSQPQTPIKASEKKENVSSRDVSPSKRAERSPSPSKRPTSPTNTELGSMIGSPSSPSNKNRKKAKKFSESDFESKRESLDPELRKKQLQAKIRGLKLEPKEWTKQELFEKMANLFNIVYETNSNNNNNNTGNGNANNASPVKGFSSSSSPRKVSTMSSNVVSEIHILNGIKLTNDEIVILNEFCRRNTEIKIVNLSNSGITDDYLKLILQGCRQLKCIKWLNLNQNYLTITGLEEIIRVYSQANQHRKKLEKITLQGNLQLTYEHGYQFVQSFLKIDQINTLPIAELKKEGNNIKIWDLSSQEIRSFEFGMICYLLKTFVSSIEELNFSNNFLNCKNIHTLLNILKNHLPKCHTINLSFNNITNNGFDMSAVTKIQYFLQSSKQVKYIHLHGIKEIKHDISESIERSCAINRSLDRNKNDFYFFNHFLQEMITFTGEKKEKEFQMRKDHLYHWKSNHDEIDEDFIKRNRLPICDIQFSFYDDGIGNDDEDDDDDDEEEEEEESSLESDRKGKSRKESQKGKVVVEGEKVSGKEGKSDTGSLMSKISYDGPTEPNTSDKIVNGFKLRWIQPKYDENMNLIFRKNKSKKY